MTTHAGPVDAYMWYDPFLISASVAERWNAEATLQTVGKLTVRPATDGDDECVELSLIWVSGMHARY